MFPGNTNTLIFSLNEYCKILEDTQGLIAEFINPKYTDATKTTFKTPTRLECMMQDYPKLLPSASKVGFTQFDRQYCFSACKNDLASAAQKIKQGLAPESASSCEAAFYRVNAELLGLAGAKVKFPPRDHVKEFSGIPLNFGPLVVLKPSFGVTLEQLQEKIKGVVSISERSTLVLDGDVVLHNVEIDGSYFIQGENTKVAGQMLKGTDPDSSFIQFVELDKEDLHTADYLRVRGYNTRNNENILTITPPKGFSYKGTVTSPCKQAKVPGVSSPNGPAFKE
jgi:UDP-sugar pyrophosphorylase